MPFSDAHVHDVYFHFRPNWIGLILLLVPGVVGLTVMSRRY